MSKKKEKIIKDLKKELLQRKKEIIESSKKELHDIIKVKEKHADEIDEAVSLHQDLIATSMLTTQNQVLKKIDAALSKIDSNTYGICEECEEKIPEGRLKVVPFAVLCISCQEEKENAEKALCIGTEIFAI